MGGWAALDWLELDVRADGVDGDVVCVEEIVAEVELVEVEGDDELCPFGGEEGRAEEGECEFGTGQVLVVK